MSMIAIQATVTPMLIHSIVSASSGRGVRRNTSTTVVTGGVETAVNYWVNGPGPGFLSRAR
jgi:hypothetical protein